jgi:acyl-homoserine-lactone acylase
MPQLERPDYVFNANDSFWLANSAEPIEGDYSPLHGPQRTVRSLRTRNNDLTLSRRSPDNPAGADGKFSRQDMKDALMSNRSYAAELLKPELLKACDATPGVRLEDADVDLGPACSVLRSWDNRFDADSRGAVLFREWIGQYPEDALNGHGALYSRPFDASDPVHTPAGLANPDLALQNLARAVRLLETNGFALDAPLGELQYAATKLPERISVHGGEGGYEGIKNMQIRAANNTTLEPLDLPPVLEGSRRLTREGYPIAHGSSFVLALEFTAEGPQADAILSYSQSGDPESPHFTDQTRLFERKQWRPVRYRESDIAANTARDYRVRSSTRREP